MSIRKALYRFFFAHARKNSTPAAAVKKKNFAKQDRWDEGNGDPGRSRTCDLRFRKPSLYPSELQGH
jgi:hypothetical protein